ncbi:MAG: hypothetical protein ABGY75_02595 [Gemmataceae bacterium]
MPWVVGIDEAGYGPNLGPLVQAAAAVRLPIEDLAGWDTLKAAARKAGGRWGRDKRVVIDDSKRVYHGVNALERLERGVLAAFALAESTVCDVLRKTAPPWCHDELANEGWYVPDHPAPVATTRETCRHDLEHFTANLPDGVRFAGPIALVTPAPWFNQVVEATGSKASLLTNGLIELMKQTCESIPGDDHLIFVCDKQGGRNYYTPLLREAFPGGQVCPDLETAAESRYRVEGLSRVVSVVFRPQADGDSIAVALASMLCKYLREVCMLQFNAFWAKHVPGIAPTAGYPLDAKRFLDEIRPAMDRLGIPEAAVWRVK